VLLWLQNLQAASGTITGTLAKTDGADVMSAIADLSPIGSSATTDGADVMSAAGLVLDVITSTMATTDGADVMVAAGTAGPAGAAAIYEIGLGLSLMRLGGRL
jgi:hypothetical protein